MKRRILSGLFLVLCLVLEHYSFAQYKNFALGKKEYKKAGPATAELAFRSVIGSIGTHSRVGGISFEQIANPDDSIVSHQQINLKYLPGNNDGRRLSIQFGKSKDSTYIVNIPDWQLIPIAKYANSSNTAVFTIFGDNANTDNPAMLYHRAFKDQLLGLRLFQADMIFFGPEMAWVPRDTDHDVLVMATSEKKIGIDTINAYKFDSMLAHTPRYQSYILTDWGREFKYGVAGGNFYISGEPYYLFTKNKQDSTSMLYKLKAALPGLRKLDFTEDASYKEMVSLIQNTGRMASDERQALKLFRALYKKYDLKNSPWFTSSFTPSDRESDSIYVLRLINSDIEQTKPMLNDADLKKFEKVLEQGIYSWTIDQFTALRKRLSSRDSKGLGLLLYYPMEFPRRGYRVDLLIQSTTESNNLNSKIFDFNPVVFNSCIVTARFAAFFRYVKANHPTAWNNFLQSLNQPGAKGDFKGTVETPDTQSAFDE